MRRNFLNIFGFRSLALFSFFLFFLFISNALGAPAHPQWFEWSAGERIEVQADSLELDRSSSKITARGNASLQTKRFNFTAETIEWFTETGLVVAMGNVVLEARYRRLEAHRMTFSQDGSVVEMEKLRIRYRNEPDTCEKLLQQKAQTSARGEFQAEKFWKTPQGQWKFENGYYTACLCPAGKEPDWSMSGESGELLPDEWLLVDEPRFSVHDMDLVELHRVKTSIAPRKSGFLAPGSGYEDRNGWMLRQEAYLTLGKGADTTFGAQGLSKRGVMPVGEFRYRYPDVGGKVEGFWLYDLKGRHSSTEADNRFQLRWTHFWETRYTRQIADVDVVSDAGLPNLFHRSLSARYADHTQSTFGVETRNLHDFNAEIQARFWQNLAYRDNPDGTFYHPQDNQSAQVLPELSFALPPLPLAGGWILPSLGVGASHVFVQSNIYQGTALDTDYYDDPTNVDTPVLVDFTRLYLSPELSIPLAFAPYLEGALSSRYRCDFLFPHRLYNDPGNYETLGEWRLDATLGSRLHRVFTMGEDRAMKHEILPVFHYRYMPYHHRLDEDSAFRAIEPPGDSVAPHWVEGRLLQRFVWRNGTILQGKIGPVVELEAAQRLFLEEPLEGRYHRLLDATRYRLRLETTKTLWQSEIGWRTDKKHPQTTFSFVRVGPFEGVSVKLRHEFADKGPPVGALLGYRETSLKQRFHQVGAEPSWSLLHDHLIFKYGIDFDILHRELIEQRAGMFYRSSCNCWWLKIDLAHRPDMLAPDVYLTFELEL